MSPDSDVLNWSAYLLRILVRRVRMSGWASAKPRRHVPADDPLVAGRTGILGDLLLVDVLLDQVGVTPVLQDRVDIAGLEALPGDLLLDVLLLDGAAELVLEDVGDDRGVGLVADPRVDRELDRATRRGAGRSTTARGRGARAAGARGRARSGPRARRQDEDERRGDRRRVARTCCRSGSLLLLSWTDRQLLRGRPLLHRCGRPTNAGRSAWFRLGTSYSLRGGGPNSSEGARRDPDHGQ